MAGMRDIFAKENVKAVVEGFPQVFHVAFGLEQPARDYRDLALMDRQAYVAFTTALLRRGVRALERGAWFMSIEHTDAIIDTTLDAVESAVQQIKRDGVI